MKALVACLFLAMFALLAVPTADAQIIINRGHRHHHHYHHHRHHHRPYRR